MKSLYLLTVVISLLISITFAQFPGDPVCLESGNQNKPAIAHLGAGKYIITWADYRYGNRDIYAQKYNINGEPQWREGGVVICNSSNIQDHPNIVEDGFGGAIITWHDNRSGNYDIYAAQVTSSGSISWEQAVCSSAGSQLYPKIITDGSGGAIITWYDRRSGNYDIYANRIGNNGHIHTDWPTNGEVICQAPNSQVYPNLISDNSSGAIITWQDYRSGNYDIYVQRIRYDSQVLWSVNGSSVCTASNQQYRPEITTDGSGGAIITWYDRRSGNYDIYVQKVNNSGTNSWITDGSQICTTNGTQNYPTIVGDGSGGAVITWQDNRSGNYDIYAQKVNNNGNIQWNVDGNAICTATSNQYYPKIARGTNTISIVWYDRRDGNYDIYAQGIDGSGNYLWTMDGNSICTAEFNQYAPIITSDGNDGAIITWYDYRNGSNSDIYAQRVDKNGIVRNVAVCTSNNTQKNISMIPDGNGGTIKVWQDNRNGDYDIYAQNFDKYGRIKWIMDGVVVCSEPGDQTFPKIAGDGAGNAIITWSDNRSNYYVYAQKINSSGQRQWAQAGVQIALTVTQPTPEIVNDGSNGAIIVWDQGSPWGHWIISCRINGNGQIQWNTNICSFKPYYRGDQKIVSDGAGGAIICWEDDRNNGDPLNRRIYAQRVLSNGSTFWTTNGVIVGNNTWSYGQNSPQITFDGANGAIITWEEYHGGPPPFLNDILAQRINGDGLRLWGNGGISVGAWLYDQINSEIVPDGSGGAVITWEDYRSGSSTADIYAQKVNSNGNTLWADNGIAVSTANNSQLGPVLTTGYMGMYSYTIISWHDNRDGAYDIYAQKIDNNGNIQWANNGLIISKADGDQKNVKIVYGGDNGGAIIAWEDNRYNDNDLFSQGISAGGLLALRDIAQGNKVDDFIAHPTEFKLLQNYPNPFNPVTTIQYELPQRSDVQINIYDLLGRKVTTLVSQTQNAGYGSVIWDATDDRGQPVSGGMYFYQIMVENHAGIRTEKYVKNGKMILLK